MPDDYVKRSDALQTVGDIHPLDYNGQGIVERIKAIPAADVVEVVRCKGCTEWQRGWNPVSTQKGAHFCTITGLFTDPDWFCKDGEPKDGGQGDV